MHAAEIINLVWPHHPCLACISVSQCALCALTEPGSEQSICQKEKICVAQLAQRSVNIGLPQSLKEVKASAQPQQANSCAPQLLPQFGIECRSHYKFSTQPKL